MSLFTNPSIFTGRWCLLLLGLVLGILVTCPVVFLVIECTRLLKQVRDSTWICSHANPCGKFPEIRMSVVAFVSDCVEYRRCMRNHLQKLTVENEKSRQPRAWIYRILLLFFSGCLALEPHRESLKERFPVCPIEWLSVMLVMGTLMVEYVLPLLLGFKSHMKPTHCGCRTNP